MALILKGRAKLKGSTVIGKRPYAIDGVFNPELVLDFQKEFYRTNSVAKTFPNAITHTRASTATYVDSTGTLQTAAINEPRLGHHVYNGTAYVNEGLLHESEARTNLITYSEDLSDAAWVKTRTTISGNTVIPNTDNNFHEINFSTVSVVSGTTYVISFEVEAAGYNFIQVVLSTGLIGNGSFQNFNLSNNTLGQGNTTLPRSIVDMGNGVSKISLQILADSTTSNSVLGIGPRPNDGARREVFVGDGVSGVTINRVQFEQAPTPSSYIPTNSGSTVTRSADVLTIPAANLPYPEPVVIGPELVTNGDGSSATGWASPRANSTLSSVNGRIRTAANTAAAFGVVQGIATEVGKVYVINFSVVANNTTNGFNPALRIGGNLSLNSFYINTSVNFSDFIFVARDTTTYLGVIGIAGAAGEYLEVDNISVREINPLALSIQMDGRVTYADEDAYYNVRFYRWFKDSDNRIESNFATLSTQTGRYIAQQEQNNVSTSVSSADDLYSPDILIPFNIASRHGSTFINGAVNGTALTVNTNPVALADLSASNILLADIYMGTIRTFRVWAQDIGDAGLVEATEPSLVPSLSLTFDGTENSFIVNDWTS